MSGILPGRFVDTERRNKMGGIWRQVWLILGREFKIDRYYLLGSLLFIVYMGFFGGLMMGQLREQPGLSFLANMMFWIIASMIGYYFSRRIAKYIAEDSYTNTLAYYRSLPIGVEALVWARIAQLLLATLFNGILLFTIMYLSAAGLREQLDLGAYVVFALTWTGFGLLLNSLYIAMEFLLRGRAYFWNSLILMAVLMLTALALHLSGVHVVASSISMSAERGAASPAMWVLLALGAAGVCAAYGFIKRGVPRRDLA